MSKTKKAFTVVELLIVIVIIAVLATLTILAYSGIVTRSSTASLQADLTNNSKKLKLYQAQYGSFPTAINASTGCPTAPTATSDPSYCLVDSGSNVIASYTGASTTFTLKMSSSNSYYQVTESTAPATYSLIADGSYMQTITSANCPSTRTRAVDARDNHTYWVQKLADGKCWMLTNLGYAGGGTNTYSDTKTLTNGTGGSETYTVASYYVVPSTTNFTTEPTAPSTSTNGTGQYGYLYNWCAAMGGQATAACANATTPTPDPNITICPYGWRLPTGVSGGELSALNTAVNGGLTNTVAGLLSSWLFQYSAIWNLNGFIYQGVYSLYISSSPSTATASYTMYWDSVSLNPASATMGSKSGGFAVRCVAN